ncbi:hypothetical protein ABIB82_004963 [Bradyrhizobium sp. i1.8.4]
MLLPMFVLISFAGILLVFGCALGYTHLKNISIIIANIGGSYYCAG